MESKHIMLLERSFAVARGVIRLDNGETEVLVTNFGGQHQHLNIETAEVLIHGIADITLPSLAMLSATEQENKAPVLQLKINPALSPLQ